MHIQYYVGFCNTIDCTRMYINGTLYKMFRHPPYDHVIKLP